VEVVEVVGGERGGGGGGGWGGGENNENKGWNSENKGSSSENKGWSSENKGWSSENKGSSSENKGWGWAPSPTPTPSSPDKQLCAPGTTQGNCTTKCTCSADGHSWGNCGPTCVAINVPQLCTLVPPTNPTYPSNCCATVTCKICSPGDTKNDCNTKCTCAPDGMSWHCLDTCPAQAPSGPTCTWVPLQNPVYPNCCPTKQKCNSCDSGQYPTCYSGEICDSCMKTCTCQSGAWECLDTCPISQPPAGKVCYLQPNFQPSWPNVNNSCCAPWVCPCDNIQCNSPYQCVVDTTKQTASCQCNKNCGNNGPQVCGSDGVTYLNICLLKYQACKTKKTIVKVSNGACPTPTSSPTPQNFNCTENTQTASCSQICTCLTGQYQCSPFCPGSAVPPGCTPVAPVNPNAQPPTIADCCATYTCPPPPLESSGGGENSGESYKYTTSPTISPTTSTYP